MWKGVEGHVRLWRDVADSWAFGSWAVALAVADLG